MLIIKGYSKKVWMISTFAVEVLQEGLQLGRPRVVPALLGGSFPGSHVVLDGTEDYSCLETEALMNIYWQRHQQM